MDLNKLSLKQLKERIVYCKFLISEIEEITKDTSDVEKIKTQYIEHLKTLNEIVDIRNKEIQLIRGKKLLEWFGIVTVFIGISFLIVDYEIWKYFNLGLVKKFYQFIVNLPGIVKFIVTSIVVCFSYWGVYSQQNKSQNKSRQILFLATILLGVDLYMMPYWLFDKEMYQLSLFLISIVTIITSYMFSFKTLLFLGLLGILNWVGGAMGYWPGCYWLYMKDPLIFLPLGIGLIYIGFLVEKHGNKELRNPFEIMGLVSLFLALLILSIWGYTFGERGFWYQEPDIKAVWFRA